MTFSVAVHTAILCLLFGANAVAMKLCFMGMGPLTTAGVRLLSVSGILVLWMAATGRKFVITKPDQIPLGVISAVFVIQFMVFYTGMNNTTAVRSTLLSNLNPFFVMIFAHFFLKNDKISFRKSIGIVLGFIGVIVLFYEKQISGKTIIGDVLIIFGVVLWAVNSVYNKKQLESIELYTITVIPMIIAAPLFLITAYCYEKPMFFHFNYLILLGLCYQILITGVYGFIAWNRLLKFHGATAMHSFVFLMPVSGVICSGLVLHESIGKNIVISLVCIVGGIFLASFKEKQKI